MPKITYDILVTQKTYGFQFKQTRKHHTLKYTNTLIALLLYPSEFDGGIAFN